MGDLFGTDGIRGTVGEWPLIPEFFLKLGQSVGSVLVNNLQDTNLLVGRDTRQSGQMLQSALVAGLLEAGVNVIDADVIPTSGIAWLIKRLGIIAGAVISASHNPVEQNGLKLFDQSGQKLPLHLEKEIEKTVLSDNGANTNALARNPRQGRLTSGNALHELYIHGLLSEHPVLHLKGLTIVVDCSNGAASRIAPEVFHRAGARTITINATPTGVNINNRAGSEFVRRSPADLANIINQYQADFGLAFDGDADRVVFIDEIGNLIDGDHILGFLSRYLDQKQQLLARSVVTTFMRNSGLKSYIENAGMSLYETPVGDKYVVDKLMKIRSESPEYQSFGLGGEQAGHIVLLDEFFTTGDGIRTGLYVMRAFKESGAEHLSQFAAGIGKVPQVIASAYVGSGKRLSKENLSEIGEKLRGLIPGIISTNLRYSGTEPQFRLMLESNGQQDEECLGEIALGLCTQVQKYAGINSHEIDILNCTKGGVINPSKATVLFDI